MLFIMQSCIWGAVLSGRDCLLLNQNECVFIAWTRLSSGFQGDQVDIGTDLGNLLHVISMQADI